MNGKIFLFQAKIAADIPFDTLVEYIKRRSSRHSRFSVNTIEKTRARVSYAYRQGLYERLGYWGGPTNEIVINRGLEDPTKVKIHFRYPASILIAYGLIAIFILAAGHFIMPGVGLNGSMIVLLVLYFGAVIRLNSQLYFFKSEIEQFEENHKNGIR